MKYSSKNGVSKKTGHITKKASKGMNTFKDMGAMGKAGSIGGMAGTAMQIYGANFGTTNPEDAATMTQAGGVLNTASGIASGMDQGKKKKPVYRKGVKMYRKGGKRC